MNTLDFHFKKQQQLMCHFKKQQQLITNSYFNQAYQSGQFFVLQNEFQVIVHKNFKRIFKFEEELGFLYSAIRKNCLIINTKDAISIIDFSTRKYILQDFLPLWDGILSTDLRDKYLFFLNRQSLNVFDIESKEYINTKKLVNAYRFYIENNTIFIFQLDQIIICKLQDLSIISVFKYMIKDSCSIMAKDNKLLLINMRQYLMLHLDKGTLQFRKKIKNFYHIMDTQQFSVQDIQDHIDLIEQSVEYSQPFEQLFLLIRKNRIIHDTIDLKGESKYYFIKIMY